MMTLCLLLTACGGTGGEAGDAADARMPYRNMAGCVMEAEVSCTQDGAAWEATLRCDYVPEGETTVEVLAPETIAGVKAVLSDGEVELVYEDQCLNAGNLSSQGVAAGGERGGLAGDVLLPSDGGPDRRAEWEDPLHPLAAAGGRYAPPRGDRRGWGNHFDGRLYELFLL